MGDGNPAGKSLCLRIVSVMETDYYYHNITEKHKRKGSTTEGEMNEPATIDFVPVMMR